MSLNLHLENRTVGEILTDIRENSSNPHEQGTRFERLFLKAAPLIPDFEIENIHPWQDWYSSTQHLGFDTQDDGIDLVAETKSGTLAAIQCKCYADEYKVGKEDIKSFISAANPQTFPLRWFVATSTCTTTAENLIARNGIRIIDFREYLDFKFDKKLKPKRKPWLLQQEAIDAVVQGFTESGRDRGRLTMACGTGKTFTALRIAEELSLAPPPTVQQKHPIYRAVHCISCAKPS